MNWVVCQEAAHAEQCELGQFSCGETRREREADFSQTRLARHKSRKAMSDGEDRSKQLGLPRSELLVGILLGGNRL